MLPLRALGKTALVLVVPALAVACGIENLSTGASKDAGTSTSATSPADAGTAVQGAGCGTDSESGLKLCAATAKCPNVVVDTQALPHCGFRIQGSVVDLVCGCNGSICSMGTFTTCAQAAQLLQTQTEQEVCMQVAEGRCAAGTPSTSSSSSPSPSGGSGSCDKQCLSDCGGGAACASLCGC